MSSFKYSLALSIFLIAAVFFLVNGWMKALTTSVPVTAAPTPTSTPCPSLSLSPHQIYYSETFPMAPEIMYGALFDEIDVLEQTDRQTKLQINSTALKISFYQNRLALKPAEFVVLDQIAGDYQTQLKILDRRAGELINQYRADYPGGNLRKNPPPQPPFGYLSVLSRSEFEALPAPPAELQQLERQRNQLILAAREKIRQSAGESEFARFERAVVNNAVKVLVPINYHVSRQVWPEPSPPVH